MQPPSFFNICRYSSKIKILYNIRRKIASRTIPHANVVGHWLNVELTITDQLNNLRQVNNWYIIISMQVLSVNHVTLVLRGVLPEIWDIFCHAHVMWSYRILYWWQINLLFYIVLVSYETASESNGTLKLVIPKNASLQFKFGLEVWNLYSFFTKPTIGISSNIDPAFQRRC